MVTMGKFKLEHRNEGMAGERWYLADQPIDCGTGLELLLPGKVWIPVRFEVTHTREGTKPHLHITLGGQWEDWRPPAGHKDGDEIRVSCETCDGAGYHDPGENCPACRGKGKRYVVARVRETGEDASGNQTCDECSGSGKVAAKRACYDGCDGGKRWMQIVRPYGAQPYLAGDALSEAILRWPARKRR